MNASQSNVTEVIAGDGATIALESMGGIQLADYDLKERIGAGGYGEVWKATGPGGLPKAVKILYGERDGSHAEAELKALERMRELRHPFLLSIERIEVVNSRLIVVTELADGNLSERFDECRSAGHAGIPRDELLEYLRDSADALDFMSEQHGLQHLDIKPDNILLQGRHAKVGDFGLAKDINVTNVSVINGFTPMYAAPELFEGRPGGATDQYSLAIVYQTMLTGVPPFPGRTAAQLTVQHLRSQPDLTHLQPVDRPVVARALSKSATSRFANCRAFVDELIRRKTSRNNRAFQAPSQELPAPRTAVIPTDPVDQQASVRPQESHPVAIRPVSADKPRRRCLFVGAGGLAGTVLRDLKRHTTNAKDAVRTGFLQLDTDRNALKSLREDDETYGLSHTELVAVPLRSSKQYRAARDMDLSWMSRRWLFNIPRSGLVEGIRPLGRLALCDHHKEVSGELKRLLTELAEDLSEDEGIDVFTVAATSGGTGSGMVNDLGLMLQAVVRDSALKDVQVNGLLLHATGATRNVSDVQDANTVSTLQELRHLMTPGLQTSRGFEDSHAMRDLAPFDNTWIVNLGDGINDVNAEAKTSTVVGFLTDYVLSPAQRDISDWRRKDVNSADEPTQVRLLGASQQNVASFQAASDQSAHLCKATLQRWASLSPVDETERVPAAGPLDTETVLTELKLTADRSHGEVLEMLRGPTGQAIEQFATTIFATAASQVDLSTTPRRQFLDTIATLVSQTNEGDSASLLRVVSGVRSTLKTATQESTTVLQEHLQSLLNRPQRLQAGLAGGKLAAAALKTSNEECAKQLSGIEVMFAELSADAQTDSPFEATADTDASGVAREFSKQYCVLLSYQAIYQCFIHHIKTVADVVDTWMKQVTSLNEQLTAISETTDSDSESQEMPAVVVDAFDQCLQADHANILGQVVADGGSCEALETAVRAAATGFLVSAIEGSTGDNRADSDGPDFPANAWPALRGLGGRRRVLGLLPETMSESDWKTRLSNEFGNCVGIRQEARQAISVICEIEGVPVESVLSYLTHANPKIDEIAGRIHTRVDTDW